MILSFQCPRNRKLNGYSGFCELWVRVICAWTWSIRLLENTVCFALLVINREVHFVRRVFLLPTSSSEASRLSFLSCKDLFMGFG